METRFNFYLIVIGLTFSGCATTYKKPAGIAGIENSTTPFLESKPLQVADISDLPDDVCWFGGRVYENNAILCQYQYGVKSIQNKKYPFQCTHESGKNYWYIVSTETC